MGYWLDRLVGHRVWAPAVGVGSFLTIEFGEPRINSAGVSQGSFHLWVYGAEWEIREQARVLASSDDPRAVMAEAALALDGATVLSVDRSRLLALTIRFAEHLDLVIKPFGDAEMEEWLLYLEDGNVIVAGPGDAVVLESARESHPLPTGRSGAAGVEGS